MRKGAIGLLCFAFALESALTAVSADTALPILAACNPATLPELPQRWHAVGLMLPFVRQQLDVGEFVYDGTLPAMRATIYGVESGSIDLLITDKVTYQLSGPRDAPDSCVALGPKYAPPSARWLAAGSVCDGEGPIDATKTQWWKYAAADGRSVWQWYRADTRLPWRVMFPARAANPAVIGDYGMTYFPTFEPAPAASLVKLRDFCAAKSQGAAGPAASAGTARELMAAGRDLGEAERARRLHELIPGLSRQACARMSVPRWPNQFVMTGILSPIPAKWTPLPSIIFYDWDKAATLSAWMHEARTVPPVLELVSVLKRGIGYSVERLPNGRFLCAAKSPGVVRPEWMSLAGCECKAVIDHNPQLGPSEVTQIRACPVKYQGQRVNWSWYSAEGRPILFAEPGAIGTGLNVADYLAWRPGETMPEELYELPQLCTRATEAGLPPVGHGLPPATTASCSDCHTTQQ